MFKSLTGLVTDLATIAVAPIDVAVNLTRVVTASVAEAALEVSEDIKETLLNER
jgi:hypothetical protein